MTGERNSATHMTVEEIELAVPQMSSEELNEFREWYEEFDAKVKDRDFEKDVKAGRLEPTANCSLNGTKERTS